MLRISLRYRRLSQLEEGYGIMMQPLEKLVREHRPTHSWSNHVRQQKVHGLRLIFQQRCGMITAIGGEDIVALTLYHCSDEFPNFRLVVYYQDRFSTLFFTFHGALILGRKFHSGQLH